MAYLEELTRDAVRLAKEARDRCKIPGVRIAGALPPLLASFSTDKMPRDEMLQQYTLMARILLEEGVDLLLIETSACIEFGSLALQACQSVSKEAEIWVSFTL